MFSLIIVYTLFEFFADINCLNRAMIFLEWLQMFQEFVQIAVLTVNAVNATCYLNTIWQILSKNVFVNEMAKVVVVSLGLLLWFNSL